MSCHLALKYTVDAEERNKEREREYLWHVFFSSTVSPWDVFCQVSVRTALAKCRRKFLVMRGDRTICLHLVMLVRDEDMIVEAVEDEKLLALDLSKQSQALVFWGWSTPLPPQSCSFPCSLPRPSSLFAVLGSPAKRFRPLCVIQE